MQQRQSFYDKSLSISGAQQKSLENENGHHMASQSQVGISQTVYAQDSWGKIKLPDSLLRLFIDGMKMEIIKEIPGRFSKLTRSSKLMVAGMGLILLLCLCSLTTSLFTQLGAAPLATATYQGADSVVIITWTPGFIAPTSTITPTSSPAPTRTPLPTSLPTRSFETATVVILPTGIDLATGRGALTIAGMDKNLEYVDIQNVGYAPVNLIGWTLVSERGEQVCRLSGMLQPREVLRVWAGTGPAGSDGLDCGFLRRIWSNNELDPAVLYNPDGDEVSRYPQPN